MRPRGNEPRDRASSVEAWIVRLSVPLALAAAIVATALLPVPAAPPDIALRSQALLRVEQTLAFFYASLLALLPVIRAVRHGELPAELSTRGARYRDIASRSGRTMEDLKQELALLAVSVEEAQSLAQATAKGLREMNERLDDRRKKG